MKNLNELKKIYNSAKKMKFIFFWGHQPSKDGSITKSCFSQWWKADFIVDNTKYYCMEQYMMAEKARLFRDYETLDEILKGSSPKKIKALGRRVRNFNEDVWNECKYNIVLKGNIAKFSQNGELKEFLLTTKERILVEASPYDKVWGIGMSADNKKIENPLMWNGENLLGFALMETREFIKNNS